jgi:hypothetical protein
MWLWQMFSTMLWTSVIKGSLDDIVGDPDGAGFLLKIELNIKDYFGHCNLTALLKTRPTANKNLTVKFHEKGKWDKIWYAISCISEQGQNQRNGY